MLYIILFVLIIMLLLFVPSRLKIKYFVDTNFDKNKKNETINIDNYIDIYILYFIKIKRINLQDNENVNSTKNKKNKKNKSSIIITLDIISKFLLELLNIKKMDEVLITKKELKNVLDNLYFEKLSINLGINLKDVILNAYAISLLNSAINMYFARNANKISLENSKYYTCISNNILNVDLESIIRFSLVNTITVILKILLRYRKVVKENGNTTSNRKFNDDSYDFT